LSFILYILVVSAICAFCTILPCTASISPQFSMAHFCFLPG
jgi:hypothetical protein